MAVQFCPKVLLQISDLLTPVEAGRIASVHEGTIHLWIKQGKLPAAKFGNQWVIHRHVLNDVLQGRVQVSRFTG